MAPELAFRLLLGDRAWEVGALASARRAYDAARRIAPRCWHARVQIAWIDLAFRPLPDVELAELASAAPDPTWRHDLRARAAEAARGVVLDGELGSWDIDSLRAIGGASRAWWERRAARAHAARQYGLARACIDEASNFTTLDDYEPPLAYGETILAARGWLAALRACDG